MKDIDKKLADVLSKAEAGVLEVIATAASSRDYATIDRARAIAERLRDISRDVSTEPTAPRTPPTYIKISNKKRKPTPKKGEYPRFEIKKGSLFKIGWSKKKGAPYVHRVPIGTVKNISGALEQLSSTVGPVSTDQILDSVFLKEAGNPPTYQTYIVLAYLKDRGIITSVGREGFTLSPNIVSRANELLRQEEEAA